MLDIRAGASAPSKPPIPPIEFVTIQLMPLADGNISVLLKATRFDEVEFDLLDDEIANEHVTTIDEALTLIRANIRFASPPQ